MSTNLPSTTAFAESLSIRPQDDTEITPENQRSLQQLHRLDGKTVVVKRFPVSSHIPESTTRGIATVIENTPTTATVQILEPAGQETPTLCEREFDLRADQVRKKTDERGTTVLTVYIGMGPNYTPAAAMMCERVEYTYAT